MATVANTTRITTITPAVLSAGPFLVGFRLFEADAIDVYVDGDRLEDTDFTVIATFSDGFDDGASVLLDTAVVSQEIRIEGAMRPERGFDYIPTDPSIIQKINVELGRLWATTIELRREASRSLRVQSEGPVVTLDAGRSVMWDGAKFVPGPTGDDIANAEEYADRAEAAAAISLASANFTVSDLPSLMASITPYPVGSILSTRAEGYGFEVVASGGDYVTAGGVQLRRRNRPVQSVTTIAALKAVSSARLATGDLYTAHGFDAAGDGCGGLFRFNSGAVPANLLDGVVMAATGGGHWVRTDYAGQVHTRWCGIRPEAAPGATYNASGFGANNRTRWQAMGAFCGAERLQVLLTKAAIVTASVYVDAGVHDFVGGNLTLPDCVSLTGAGRGVAVLRANITSGVFLTVGSVGDFTADSSLESAFADFSGVSILSHTDVTGGTGLMFANTFRATHIREIFVRGFDINLHLDAFGANISNVWLQSGNTNNLLVGPRCNSVDISASRFDDQRSTAGDNILISEAGFARAVRIARCDIQRSYGKALRFLDVAQAEIRGCFFEGNNRGDLNHPDIWIDGAGVKNFVIDSNYFTGTGRFNSTTSRAINVRSSVTANASIQITNNEAANSAQGTFEYFAVLSPAAAMKVACWNNRYSGMSNSIHASIVLLGLTSVGAL